MKAISTFLVIMMVFMVGSTPMKAGGNEVVLNASQVSSAIDIETAINIATDYGTQPGIVALDSSMGDFVYTDIDRSINIFVPNITLRSENGAVIQNCDDGVFFDDVEADWVTVEGVTFNCVGAGIAGGLGHSHAVIRGNTFHAGLFGIWFDQTRETVITENDVDAQVYAISISVSNDVEISMNELKGETGISLTETENARILRNSITASNGMLLGTGSSHNRIAQNDMFDVAYAGVLFDRGTEYNKLISNKIHCQEGFQCEVYRALYPPIATNNKIAGNKVIFSDVKDGITATLEPGVWSTFTLGEASDGFVYIADVTPLHGSVDGASISHVIKPVFNGQQWNDVLHVMLAEGAPEQDVLIEVYRLSGLPTILDLTEDFPPGEWRGYAFARPTDNPSNAYLVDLDPLEPSVEGATFARYLIHPEFPWGEWLDIFRVATAVWLPEDPLTLRARIYATDQLDLASEINITLTPYDDWVGHIVGQSSLQRGYVVRPILLGGDSRSDLDGYTVQAEFNGYQWNDVLRIHIGNPYADWESVEYNFQVYACDDVVCP